VALQISAKQVGGIVMVAIWRLLSAWQSFCKGQNATISVGVNS